MTDWKINNKGHSSIQVEIFNRHKKNSGAKESETADANNYPPLGNYKGFGVVVTEGTSLFSPN